MIGCRSGLRPPQAPHYHPHHCFLQISGWMEKGARRASRRATDVCLPILPFLISFHPYVCVCVCVSNLHFNQQHLLLSRRTPAALRGPGRRARPGAKYGGPNAAAAARRRAHDLSHHHHVVSRGDGTQAGNCDVRWLSCTLAGAV